MLLFRRNAKIYIERYLIFCGFLTLFFVLTFLTDQWPFSGYLTSNYLKRANEHGEIYEPCSSINFRKFESDSTNKRKRRQLRDGEWAIWAPWTPCAVHDEIGRSVQTRTRSCNGGGNCEGGESSQARACLPSNSPPAATTESSATAEWRAWSEWTECHSPPPGQIGTPYRTRWRECDRNRCYGASNRADCQPCRGDAYEQAACGSTAGGREYPEAGAAILYDATRPLIYPRQYENCQWGAWSMWSTCSATCGRNARRYRARTCSCAIRRGCGLGSPIEDELCGELPNCGGGYGAPSQGGPLSPFYNPPPPPPQPQHTPAGTGDLGYPCNMCPPRYPFPCYTCINLKDPHSG